MIYISIHMTFIRILETTASLDINLICHQSSMNSSSALLLVNYSDLGTNGANDVGLLTMITLVSRDDDDTACGLFPVSI